MSAPEDQSAWPSSRLCLDGTWEFIPGEHRFADLPAVSGVPIQVPGLWEAQGHLDLDGDAWYRRRFAVDDPAGWWTLRFGAVMDDAEVYLNGRALGSHRGAFTPFELACTGLVPGVNEIAVRVTEHPAGSLAVVEQLWAGDPAELWSTAKRMLDAGLSREAVLGRLARAATP
jgi:beta-galactosidase/beta-glucuronidase